MGGRIAKTSAPQGARGGLWRGLNALAGRYFRGRRGAVSPMLALALVPIIGALGMAVEGSNWWMTQRSLQNAADTAALAAAVNGTTTCSGTCGAATYTTGCGTGTNAKDYDCEAVAAAARAGFINGANNVAVLPQYFASGAPCPDTTKPCYQVAITKKLPLYLLQVVGFAGNTTIASAKAQSVSVLAIAAPTGGGSTPFCVFALGSSAKKNLTINGGPKSNLPGCAVGSNGATDCNGQPISGTIASYAANGDANSCADNGNNIALTTTVTDPYLNLASNIPPHPCGSYFQESKKTTLPSSNLLSGTYSGTTIVCGDAKLIGATTLSPGAILVIVDGQLNTNSLTITGNGTNAVTGANGATVIFTGNSNPGITPTSQFLTGGGTVSITAPSSGTWSGMALYQDPNTADVAASSYKFAGNSPTFQINGLIYAPNAGVTIAGDIGSNTACVGFLVNTFTIDGTGNVIDEPGCKPITLTGPSFGTTRIALVK